MERDSAHRPRDQTARGMMPDGARSTNSGDARKLEFNRRANQTRSDPSKRQGGEPISVHDVIARHHDQARRAVNGQDAGIASAEPVQPEDTALEDTQPPSDTQSHYIAGAVDSRIADAAPHSRRPRLTNHRFREMDTPDAAPTAPSSPAPNPSGTNDTEPAAQKQTTGANRKPQSGDTAPRASAARSSRLQFSKDEIPPSPTPPGDTLKKASAKAEHSKAKLDAAKKKLPQKHSVKISKTFDTEAGKSKRTLRFETEAKSEQAHLKGPVVTRPLKAGVGAAVALGHRKLYEAEQENVGTQAAHRGEMVAEGGLRSVYHLHKTAPYRKVERLGQKTTKLNIKASYQQALADNPKLKSSVLSRVAQKRKIKREYAKTAREVQKTAQRVKKTGSAIGRAGRSAVRAVAHHPVVFAVICILLLLVLLISSLFSAFSDMASGGIFAIAASSYLAEDADINSAELYYTELETDMQIQIANTGSDRPGFDEYRYNIDGVGHDPFELMAYLTVLYQDFTVDAIAGDLQAVFHEQYQLIFSESTETRYADPGDGNGDGNLEPYDWHVLTVTLTSRSLYDVVWDRMDGDQQQHYTLLLQTKGNRQYVDNPFTFDWLPYVSGYYGYRISPSTGAKELYQGVDIAVPQGTEIHAGFDGTVVASGYDSGYGNYILIQDGNDVEARYAHCDTLTVTTGQTISDGDVIGTVGSTGDAAGPGLYLEVIKDGQTLNPLYFAITGDDGSGALIAGTGSSGIVEVAASQIGNVGGQPYWRWYGFSSYVNWCACFVSWCANQCGYIGTEIIPKFASCSAGIAWFQARGEWQGRNYVPAPGDLIFYDWQGDGVCDHVGIVENVEDGRVHTIEGNTSNSVARRSYSLGSGVIVGYGIPAY